MVFSKNFSNGVEKYVYLHFKINKHRASMLTLKMIMEETDRVIRGLEKKHFKGAKESIAKLIELNGPGCGRDAEPALYNSECALR